MAESLADRAGDEPGRDSGGGIVAPEVLGSDLKVTLADGRVVAYANLDYAATAPCLAPVAAKINELLPWHASAPRGAGPASRRCTREYEQARETIADFFG